MLFLELNKEGAALGLGQDIPTTTEQEYGAAAAATRCSIGQNRGSVTVFLKITILQ